MPEASNAHDGNRKKSGIRLPPPELWLRIVVFTAFAGQCTLARVASLSSSFIGAAAKEFYLYQKTLSTKILKRIHPPFV